MKKKMLVASLIILILIASIFIYNDMQTIKQSDIKAITVEYNNNKRFIDTEDIEKFLELYNESDTEYLENLSDNTKKILITFSQADENKTIDLIYDFDKDDVFLIKDNTIYEIDRNKEFFLTGKYFEDIYNNNTIPEFLLVSNNKKYQANDIKGNWSYKGFNNDVINKKINVANKINNDIVVNDTVTLDATVEPESIKLTVYNKNDDVLFNNNVNLNENIFVPLYDGTYEYVFDINYEDSNYNGDLRYIYNVSVDKEGKFDFKQVSINQGEFLEIKAYNFNSDENIFIKQEITRELSFFNDGNYKVAYLPISYNVTPGTYDIKYGVTDDYEKDLQLTVHEMDYSIQYLYANESLVANNRNAQAYEEFNQYFPPSREVSSDQKYHDNNFILPVKGRLSTEYGEQRYINDSKTSYNHSGIDIAAPQGTDIKATNRGKVTLARDFILTGKTITIDHGHGIFSIYYHLNEMHVEKDGLVEKGEIIGTVGSSGFSTGPHLHFIISIYDNNLSPGKMIYGEQMKYNNYQELMDE